MQRFGGARGCLILSCARYGAKLTAVLAISVRTRGGESLREVVSLPFLQSPFGGVWACVLATPGFDVPFLLESDGDHVGSIGVCEDAGGKRG